MIELARQPSGTERPALLSSSFLTAPDGFNLQWALDLEKLVPPAQFLALIEEGFAHWRVAAANAAFVLRRAAGCAGAVSETLVAPRRRGVS
jgi:hypothetical protein